MPPKPKPAVTARQAQSKSKPTSKHSYVPPELAGSSTRKTWVPASRHKIAEAKFHGKGKSAGHSSDENESGHEDDGNEIAGEDEKGNNRDESDMDGGGDDSEIADESGPQYYDRDGNPVPIEEIAAVLQRPRDPSADGTTLGLKNLKKRQVLEDESDEDRTQAPKTPKRQRIIKSNDDTEKLDGDGAERPEEEAVDIKPKRKGRGNVFDMSSVNKTALDKTNRETFQKLCGYDKAYDAEPQQVDENGAPSYRKRVGPNELVTPGSSRQLSIGRHGERTSSSYFGRCPSRSRAWTEHRKYAMQKENNTFEGSLEKHKRQTLMNTRANALFVKRSGARKGTCVEGEEFNLAFAKTAQSPQYIDPNNKKRVIRIEPEWVSDEVVKLKDATDLVVQLSGKDGATIEYLKYNLPISKAGSGMQYPRWMVSDSYIEAHPDEWAEKSFMFDQEAKMMPDISKFTKRVGNRRRTYLEEAPEWLQSQLAADLAASSRSVSPSISIQSRSATPLMAMSDAPCLLPAFQPLGPVESPSRPSRLRPAPTVAPELEIDPRLLGDRRVFSDTPVGSDCPTYQPGDIAGFSAEGRPLYAHAGDPRHPRCLVLQPVHRWSVNQSSRQQVKREREDKKKVVGSGGKSSGKGVEKSGNGGAQKGTKSGLVTLKLPARTTRSAKK
ncbi:hypothetical protein RhiJN_12973 [Ceratobasidium sp. AG-Ba]|nr:hypothetical protein RhiJN_12973 [Ceratobasidium sp. AG-Ba]